MLSEEPVPQRAVIGNFPDCWRCAMLRRGRMNFLPNIKVGIIFSVIFMSNVISTQNKYFCLW